MDADTHERSDAVDDEVIGVAVEVFRLLADATRVRIIVALTTAEELSVNQLAELVGKTPAGVSQHLAKLRMARLVSTRHQAQRVYYRLAQEHAAQLVTDALHQAEHSLDDSPRHHRDTGSGR